jgi:hypothetical protein
MKFPWSRGRKTVRPADSDSGRQTAFVHLNDGWNADANAPGPHASPDGEDIVLTFLLDGYRFDAFEAEEQGALRFHACSRYRFTPVNDHGWFAGQCRFSDCAPEWGEFYEVVGDFREDWDGPDWTTVAETRPGQRNFLFYFRDNTFECSARDWSFDGADGNALLQPGGSSVEDEDEDEEHSLHG